MGPQSYLSNESVLNETYLGRVIVLVVHPALPARRNFLRVAAWKPGTCVSELHKTALVFVLASEVLIIPVTEFICANQWCEIVAETSFLVRVPHWFSAQQSANETFLSVQFHKLRSHHANGNAPRPHFDYLLL